jgi:SpoVK/Ycf46/Vps4 family AAA+-type ATPase
VLDDWGLGAKLSRGRGLSALFSGAPGTGKTMAAEVLAGSLGLDLYVVELATVVSKYIGETEKNLARIFDASEAGGAMLFFDEADALFGKRSEVKDAHDRYANIEVSYLLQRIENHTGLVVLATNLKRNLDDAFLRRLTFLVEFPFPGVEERARIWRSVMPPKAPLASDIKWVRLAETFPIAGGNIRSAAMHATYQAAASDRPIGMVDLLRGVRRELDKLGRAPRPEDFGAYWLRVK